MSYDYGDTDQDLCRRCVRPVTDVTVGTDVIWYDEDEDGFGGVVTALLPNGRYEITLDESDETVELSRAFVFIDDPMEFEFRKGAYVIAKIDGDVGLSYIDNILPNGKAVVVDVEGVSEEKSLDEISFDRSWYQEDIW